MSKISFPFLTSETRKRQFHVSPFSQFQRRCKFDRSVKSGVLKTGHTRRQYTLPVMLLAKKRILLLMAQIKRISQVSWAMYIVYNISMKGQLINKIQITNRAITNDKIQIRNGAITNDKLQIQWGL